MSVTSFPDVLAAAISRQADIFSFPCCPSCGVNLYGCELGDVACPYCAVPFTAASIDPLIRQIAAQVVAPGPFTVVGVALGPPLDVQLKNPRSGLYVKIDRERGTLKHKETPGRFEGVPVIEPESGRSEQHLPLSAWLEMPAPDNDQDLQEWAGKRAAARMQAERLEQDGGWFDDAGFPVWLSDLAAGIFPVGSIA